MQSQRKVISESEILAIECPTCARPAGKTCVNWNSRMPLSYRVGATECSFHSTRILAAQDNQLAHFGFKTGMTVSERTLIMHYAFGLLCDSVASKSQAILGKQVSSEDVSRHFLHQAMEELRNDGLFKDAKTN